MKTGAHVLTWKSIDRAERVSKADCSCGVSYGSTGVSSEQRIRELHAAHVQEAADREQAEREVRP